MLKRMLMIGSAMAGIALLIVAPLAHATLVAANLVVHLFVLGLQCVAARLPRRDLPTRKLPEREPFISIHVPAHNEPPELLKQTLLSLSRLKWSNYEVLVIDNNTTDETLWRPVEEYCRELGPRFRFLHVENLPGYKAGAMNWARQFMDERAEFIFVVDADYHVHRKALQTALRYHTDEKIGLIQFPQAYRNTGPGNLGIVLDFKHFFSGYMTMANELNCVPSTGTLSLISVAALKAIGGFDTTSITEDAELGFRLSLHGYRAVFVNECIGNGVLPHDLESLKKQRWRWAFGNAQILKLNWRRILFGRELNWRQKLGFITHLTAWFNFNLIPSLSLILLAPLALVTDLTPLQHYVVILSGFTLSTFMVLRFGTMFYSLRHDGHTLREIWLAYLTHLGLGWIFSASWLKCLWDHRSPFVRTNKFVGAMIPGILRVTLVELVLGVGLLVACAVLAVMDFLIGPVAALLMCCGRFLIYWVAHQSKHTWEITQRAVQSIESSLGMTSARQSGEPEPAPLPIQTVAAVDALSVAASDSDITEVAA